MTRKKTSRRKRPAKAPVAPRAAPSGAQVVLAEIKSWAEHFNLSARRLREVMLRSGPKVKDIERFLNRR